MKEEDRKWLMGLQRELWEFHPAIQGRSYGHATEIRGLDKAEWKKLESLMASEDDLIISLGTHYGFTLLVNIFECEIYPGTGAKHLLLLGQSQVPVKGIDGATLGGAGAAWKIGWELFTKYSHSERNAEKLKFHNMEAPQERSHYTY